ncbi:MAG: hypothetical protein GVY31_08790 [Alphaproteobacteria bacterium]|nr:hypothetical protein [Alphaproteobacteria bacterium]
MGEVALDDPDLSGALARLRAIAGRLEPGGIATKVLLPDAQIKYLSLDGTQADDADVRAALDGVTPYSLDDLAYDYSKGGGRTHIAAVARETLDEAESFALEHDFNPVSFVAVPDPFTFVGEPFFGPARAAAGQDIERDDAPVTVVGRVDDPSQELPTDTDKAAPESPPSAVAPETETSLDEMEPPAPVAADEADPQQDAGPEQAATGTDDGGPAPGNDDSAAGPGDDLPAFGSHRSDDPAADAAPPPVAPDITSPPQSEAEEESPAEEPVPLFGSRRTPPPLVATRDDAGTAPPLSFAPGAAPEPVNPVPDTLAADEPAPADEAPPVTGQAPETVPEETAPALAASLSATPGPSVETAPEPVRDAPRGPGLFRSRRMARRPETGAKTEPANTATAQDERNRMTVFGARKPAKPPREIGGKPRFLGLILTALLILFMLAVAALAAFNEETLSRWFGWGDETVQTAAMPKDVPTADPAAPAQPEAEAPEDPDDTAPEVAAAPASDATEDMAPDTLGAETDRAPVGTVLSPAEAQRIYAATGVWQRAPRIPDTPNGQPLDEIAVSDGFATPGRRPPGGLPENAAQDAVIAAPINPPAPDTEFDFGPDGFVVATPEGTQTPDGILVFAATPDLTPPPRPGTEAPERTVLEQLAPFIPDGAETRTDAQDGIVVVAAAPLVEPPVRPGTVAPDTDSEAAQDTPPAEAAPQEEGLVVITGAPPLQPPARPGTDPAPAPDTPLEEGLNLIEGTPPLTPPARPVAFAAFAMAPGDLTRQEAAALRPRPRPAGLALTEAPTPEQEDAAAAPQDQASLALSAEIAAAVQAAAARPDPFAGATAQAPAASLRPDTRPRNFDRVVANARPAPAVAQPARPSGPTTTSVARAATEQNAINLRRVNLIGVYGSSNDRRALVRLSNGRYSRVTVGDRLDGGRVRAIGASSLIYVKRGRQITLDVGG